MATLLESTRTGRRAVLAAFGGVAALGRGRRTEARASRRVRFAFFGTESEQRAYQRLITAFEEAQPEITVDPVGMASGDASLMLGTLQGSPYQPWLWSSLASVKAPDVFVLSYQRFPAYAARGVLEPLGPYLQASSVVRADEFYPGALDAFRMPEIADDGLGALPLNASSLVVYLNTDLFAQRGVALPTAGWSWDEFADVAAALTVDQDQDGLIGVHGLAIEPRLTRSAAFVWGAGGELVDDRARPTRLTLESEAAQDGLRWFASLGPAGRKVTPTADETRRLNDLARFASGRAAMLVQTRRVVPALRETAGLRWDVAPLPVGKAPANVLHSDGLCMLTGARDKEAAWAFIEFAVGPVGQTILAETGRTVPSLRAVAESDAFLRGTARAMQIGSLNVGLAPANSQVFLENIAIARQLPAMATLSSVQGTFDSAFSRAFYVDADVKAAASTIAVATRGMLGDRLTVPQYMFKEAETGAEE